MSIFLTGGLQTAGSISFPEHLRDNKDQNRTAETPAGKEIYERVADGGKRNDVCKKNVHMDSM